MDVQSHRAGPSNTAEYPFQQSLMGNAGVVHMQARLLDRERQIRARHGKVLQRTG